MEARNRDLSEWFHRVDIGQLLLPRFQRYEAWSHTEVSSLLEAVIRDLPAGAALVLQVGDAEPFKSRMMKGAPEPTERVNEHLLDGQQRLTALYRAFHDDYNERTYFVRFEQSDNGDDYPVIESQARWKKPGNPQLYPLWADDPSQVHERGLIPIKLLRPGDVGNEIHDWCDPATNNDLTASRALDGRVRKLRESLVKYNIPYLYLPSTTPRHVAIDVFIKLNSNSVKLSPFDIVVAQLEEAVGASLHELTEDLNASVPHLRRYRKITEFILDVAALRENRPPTQSSYQQLDLEQLEVSWQSIIDSLRFAVETLEGERIFDGERLPTVAVLPVLAALHPYLPKSLDDAGNARALVRAYLWRAFTTSRYEQSAATRSLQDLRGLQSELSGVGRTAPIFDEDTNPLPTMDDILRAGWPKKKDVLARGVLAASLRAGGQDPADGAPATADNLAQREYHHLFPDALMTGTGRGERESYLAVNCALITWNTNRSIAAKEPFAYLQERIRRATLGEDEIRRRLATHLIPFEPIAEAGGYSQVEPDLAAKRIAEHYDRFCRARAEMVSAYIMSLTQGNEPPAV